MFSAASSTTGKSQHAVTSITVLGKELEQCLFSETTTLAHSLILLDRIESASLAFLLKDIENEASRDVEDELWSAHHRVYTRLSTKLNNGHQLCFVQLQSLSVQYLKFLKKTQRFYRHYILSLSQTYGGIPELKRTAFHVRSAETVNSYWYKYRSRNRVLSSCHDCLIRLGDLSRYRELIKPNEERKYEHAKDYYDLAGSIMPSNGMSQNQLAVIALAAGNLFEAVHLLHRSIMSFSPHPQAEVNLLRALQKVRHPKHTILRDNEQTTEVAASVSDTTSMRFLSLVDRLYGGLDVEDNNVVEDDTIDQLVNNLISRGSQKNMSQVVLISIAALDHAKTQLHGKPESTLLSNAFSCFQLLNLTLFATLLRRCENEVAGPRFKDRTCVEGYETLLRTPNSLVDHILPAILMYSIWLKNYTQRSFGSMTPPVQEPFSEAFWLSYATTLSRLAKEFPAEMLHDLPYALPEEVSIVGQKPFQPVLCNENAHVNTLNRLAWYEIERRRSTSEETCARVKYIMEIGVELVSSQAVPLRYDPSGCLFTYSNKI